MRLAPVVLTCLLALPASALGAVKPGEFRGKQHFKMTLGKRAVTVANKRAHVGTMDGSCTDEHGATSPWFPPDIEPVKMKGGPARVGEKATYKRTFAQPSNESDPPGYSATYKYVAKVLFTSKRRAEVKFTMWKYERYEGSSVKSDCRSSAKDVLKRR